MGFAARDDGGYRLCGWYTKVRSHAEEPSRPPRKLILVGVLPRQPSGVALPEHVTRTEVVGGFDGNRQKSRPVRAQYLSHGPYGPITRLTAQFLSLYLMPSSLYLMISST